MGVYSLLRVQQVPDTLFVVFRFRFTTLLFGVFLTVFIVPDQNG